MIPENEFETRNVACLIFTESLDKIYLCEYEPNIYDILNITLPEGQDEKIYMENILMKQYGFDVPTIHFRTVTRIMQYEKKWITTVLMTTIDPKNQTHFFDLNKLPIIMPYLKWLIPMSIDPEIYSTSYNQILFT